MPTWGVVVSATLERDPLSGAERVCVTVTSTPAPTPEGLSLADALDRLQPALAPGEALAVYIEGLEYVVGDPGTWPALLGLPRCVVLVHALGTVFDLRDEEDAALWRLVLRLVAEPAAGKDGRRGDDATGW